MAAGGGGGRKPDKPPRKEKKLLFIKTYIGKNFRVVFWFIVKKCRGGGGGGVRKSCTAISKVRLLLRRYTWIRETKTGNIVSVQTWHCGTLASTMLPWKSNTFYIFWVCVCRLSYPACNIIGLSSCTILFPQFLINGKIFGKKLIQHKICFDFLYKYFLNHFPF